MASGFSSSRRPNRRRTVFDDIMMDAGSGLVFVIPSDDSSPMSKSRYNVQGNPYDVTYGPLCERRISCPVSSSRNEKARNDEPIDHTNGPQISFDCLILVMNWLPFKTRVLCERVSRLWRLASRTSNSTTQSSICFFSSKKIDVNKNSIQNFCSHVDHFISFNNDCVFATEDITIDVMSILSRCPNLRSLHVRGYEEENLIMDNMSDLVTICPNIEHLSISDDTRGCYVYKDCLTIVENCPNLRHLQIRFPAEGSLEFLIENTILKKSMFMNRDHLEVLSTNLPLNNENCEIIANDCPIMSSLSLHGTSGTIEGLTMLCTSPLTSNTLKYLSITIDFQLQLNLISEYLTRLESIRVAITNTEVTDLRCLSNLRRLRSFFLSIWTPNRNIDDDIVYILQFGCGHQLLKLSINGEVTDRSLCRLSEVCPQLETLEIALNSDPNSVTDTTIELGLCPLRRLRNLALNRCNVTDDGLRSLLQRNSNFEFLRLTIAERLSADVIDVLDRYASSTDRRRRRKRLKVVLPKNLIPPFRAVDVRRGSVVMAPNPFLTLKFD